MRPVHSLLRFAVFAAVFSPFAQGQAKETVLYSFGTHGLAADGAGPVGQVVFDQAGNMYGATLAGGESAGTVFELSPTNTGGWTETIIHKFDGVDGAAPRSGLILDSQGNLYGTTFGSGCVALGCGTVFELSPSGNGQWNETVLHSFTSSPDGEEPYSSVIFDSQGNLYGTTSLGGAYGFGTVFELSPPSVPGGSWTEAILYSFCPPPGNAQYCPDGAFPEGSVIFDKQGNLYGTTEYGPREWGLVYELSKGQDGTWTETVLYKFNGMNGGNPEAGLVMTDGALYGTIYDGGNENPTCIIQETCGGMFKLTSLKHGWLGQTLLLTGSNGGNPTSPITLLGNAGYTTATMGGARYGAVLKVQSRATGLYIFCPNGGGCPDGAYPFGGVVVHAGKLYGTASGGGDFQQGVVFSIAP